MRVYVFDREIIGNSIKGAKKFWPSPLGPQKKFWSPLFDPIKILALPLRPPQKILAPPLFTFHAWISRDSLA